MVSFVKHGWGRGGNHVDNVGYSPPPLRTAIDHFDVRRSATISWINCLNYDVTWGEMYGIKYKVPIMVPRRIRMVVMGREVLRFFSFFSFKNTGRILIGTALHHLPEPHSARVTETPRETVGRRLRISVAISIHSTRNLSVTLPRRRNVVQQWTAW